MSNLSQENIAWAAQALRDGRSLEFVASVLEVKPRKAQAIINVHSRAPVLQKPKPRINLDGPHVWRASEKDSSLAKGRAEKYFKNDDEPLENVDEYPENVEPGWDRRKPRPVTPDSAMRDRRKFLLCARFAKHWDMIWYCIGRGMSGRSVRKIYGSECLIWARGGGIDIAIE